MFTSQLPLPIYGLAKRPINALQVVNVVHEQQLIITTVISDRTRCPDPMLGTT